MSIQQTSSQEFRPDERLIRLVTVLGSVRPRSLTGKGLKVATEEIARHPHVSLELIDPATLDLPLPGAGTSADVARIRELVEAADGVILATPEYHGSFSSVMKLLIDNLGFPSTLAGKPTALLGVAAGRIGAIKALEHLRSVASHVGALVLPGPVSISSARGAFDDQNQLIDPQVDKLVRGLATGLIDYIENRRCPERSLEASARAAVTAG